MYKKYVIEIAYKDKKENIRIESRDIEWTMRQYARNREHFEWTIINEEEN